MDKEWLKYWQKVEGLDGDEKEEKDQKNLKNPGLEQAKDLFKNVLSDDN